MKFLFSIIVLCPTLCFAAFPRVDADLAIYDQTVSKMKSDFSKIPSDVKNKDWVKLKLANMVGVDQYFRNFSDIQFKNKYSDDERKYFETEFGRRGLLVDPENTKELKALLLNYEWFRISIFGPKADGDAWLLVQHADQDIEFQKEILIILEKMYKNKETDSSNYAYLFDRVALSYGDDSKRTLQRYGTQGRCKGKDLWEPWPMEDPRNVDSRRSTMGMKSMNEYKKMFIGVCFENQDKL